jgi:hypothetical protein
MHRRGWRCGRQQAARPMRPAPLQRRQPLQARHDGVLLLRQVLRLRLRHPEAVAVLPGDAGIGVTPSG